MEVRALVAIVQNPQQIVSQHIKNHYNQISQSPTQANFYKRPFSPLVCTHGCGCFDSYQRVTTAHQDRMRPTMQPIQQQSSCCGSVDCMCRRNQLMYEKVNRGTDMSMMMLDSERITRQINMHHHYHHIDLTQSVTQNGADAATGHHQLFMRDQPGSQSVSSIQDDAAAILKTTDRQLYLNPNPPAQIPPPQHALQTSVHETDGERQLTNPLNQFEEYVKRTQSAVGQTYINSKLNNSSINEVMKNSHQLQLLKNQNRRGEEIQIKNQNFLVGGTAIENHRRTSTAGQTFHGQVFLGNPQIQIVKTICSTKNSFLPNFKTKKREYQFGEHKLNNIQNSLQVGIQPSDNKSQNNRGSQRQETPYSQNRSAGGTRLFSPLAGSLGSNSPPKEIRGQPMPKIVAEGVKKTELKYLHKLEKLVQHKPKLSNLIKETINRTARNQIVRTQQAVTGNKGQVIPQNSQISDGMIFQSIAPDTYYQQKVPPLQLPQSAQLAMRPRPNGLINNTDTFSNNFDEFLAEYNKYNDLNGQNFQEDQPNQNSSVKRAVIIKTQQNEAQEQNNFSPQVEHLSQPHTKDVSSIDPHQQQLSSLRNAPCEAGITTPYYLMSEEVRQGTEEDTNYLKFIVNEMKPNYHIEGKTRHFNQLTNDTANSPAQLDEKILAQLIIEGGIGLNNSLPLTLDGDIPTDPLPSDASPVNRSTIRKGVIVNNGDFQQPFQNDKIVMIDGLEDESDLDINNIDGTSLQNEYFRDSLQNPRSKSQGMKNRPKVQLKQEVIGAKKRNASGRSQQSKLKRESLKSSLNSSYGVAPALVDGVELRSLKIKQSTLQSRRLGSSISHNQPMDHLGEETINDVNQSQSLINRRIMSEHQSIDSSQYKTIKFKLMIMKSPQAFKLNGAQIDSPSQQEKPGINNRQIGGRQSSKNFRKDLKRYTMLDVVSGASPEMKRTREHKSSMQVDQPAYKNKKTESFKNSSPQKKAFQGKFQGIKGDKINIAHNNAQPIAPKQLSDAPKTTSLTVLNNNLNQYGESLKPPTNNNQNNMRPGDKLSQDTFINSSAVPLPNNMNSIYKGRQVAQSKVSNCTTAQQDKFGRESLVEKSRYDNQELEEEEKMDQPNRQNQHITHQLQIINTDDEVEEQDMVMQTSMKARPLPPYNANQQQSQINDTFSFKSGGEIGGGLFSNVTNHGDETESENKNNMMQSNLPKSAYLVMPRSSQSRRDTNSRRSNRKSHQLNQDLHSMIIQGGQKTRHTRDHQKTPTANTVIQKGGSIRIVGPEDRETLNQPTVIPKVDNIEADEKNNDTLSFETSVHSHHSNRNDDQASPGDKTTKSNDGIHFEDLYLRNANYIMRYLDAPQPHQIEETFQNGGSGHVVSVVDHSRQENNSTLVPTSITNFMRATPIPSLNSPQNFLSPKMLKTSQKHKSAKQRIAEVQLMNQRLKIKPQELGEEVLQGRPIKPLKQLIKENFQQFAIHNLKLLEDKKNKRMTQLQQFFIDLQGSTKNSTHVIKKSPNIIEEDEDIRLQNYIWNTINQLKQEGYPIDTSMLPANLVNQKATITEEGSVLNTLQDGSKNQFESKAFSNKRIKNAQKNQFVTGISSLENSERAAAVSLETSERTGRTLMERHRGKKASQLDHPNADLIQIKFKDEQQEGHQSSVTLVIRQDSENSILGKMEGESAINKDDKIETLSSNPGSHRGENSYISPAVTAIYTQDYSLDAAALPKENLDKQVNEGNKQELRQSQKQRIPVSDYFNSQKAVQENAQDSKLNVKKLPFDLHLLRMNTPNLPQQLSPRQPQQQKPRLQGVDGLSSQHPHSSRRYLNSMGSQMTTGRVLSQPPASPNHKPNVRIHNSTQLRNSELDKRNFNPLERNSNVLKSERLTDQKVTDSMIKPSHESKIPNGIGEIVIKTYDRIRTSNGTHFETNITPKNDIHSVTGAPIFVIKSPGLQGEIAQQTNIMHMRNRTTKLQTTNGIFSPQNLQKQYAAEINEFSGAEIVIKDLNTLRNRDVLKIPQSSDYTPSLSLLQSKDQRLLYSRVSQQRSVGQRKLLSSEINFGGTHQFTNSRVLQTPQNYSQMQYKQVLTPQSVYSPPTPQNMYTNIGFIQSNGRKTSIDNGPHSQRRADEARRCGSQFQKVKKGRVLEDNTSGTKVSNGIRIIA